MEKWNSCPFPQKVINTGPEKTKLDSTVQRTEYRRWADKVGDEKEMKWERRRRRNKKETEEEGVLFTAGLPTLIQIRSPDLAMGDHIPGLMQAKVNDCKLIYGCFILDCFSKNIGCLIDKIRVGQLADFFWDFILITWKDFSALTTSQPISKFQL